MSIKVNLDLLLVKRKMKLQDLSNNVGITMANLSILKQIRRGRSAFPLWRPCAANCPASRGIYWNMSHNYLNSIYEIIDSIHASLVVVNKYDKYLVSS